MDKWAVKEGDVVHINMALQYPGHANEYDAIVLWHGFGNQPLITRTNEYKPHWSTYTEIERVIGHIDLERVIHT